MTGRMVDNDLTVLVAAVREWQHNPRVRSIRCIVDPAHRPLEPIVTDGRVILQCPDCVYSQGYIPSSVLHAFTHRAFERT